MRAASEAAATASLPRSSRAEASASPRSRSTRVGVIGRVGQEALVAVGGCLPVPRRQAHVDLEPRPGRVALVDEVAGRQPEPLGEVAQGDHRGSRDPGLERADVRLRVPIARELLLRQAGTVARLAEALTDVLRERSILIGRGARAGLRARHGRSLHALASLT